MLNKSKYPANEKTRKYTDHRAAFEIKAKETVVQHIFCYT